MRTNKISLNIFRSCLESKGFDVVNLNDRVKLHINSANKIAKIKKIDSEVNQRIIPRSLPHHDTMSWLIDASQPDTAYLEQLNGAVNGDYVINYVEFAMDILCQDKAQRNKLRKLLNAIIVFKRKRSGARFYFKTGKKKIKGKYRGKKTHYFGNRYEHKDILVIYSDNSSKTKLDSYCVHIEMRLIGSKKLKEFGIYTIQDLIDFPHETIWNQYLDLWDVSYTQLGRLSPKAREGLTDSSYRRQGQQLFHQYGSAQKLLMENPHYAEAFSPIKNRRMLESRLDSALR